jgi:hypothetical protein
MKVFLASYGGAHAVAVLPVWHELRRRGHEPFLLALTTAKTMAERAGVTFSTPADYVDFFDPSIRHWGERLADRHHTEGKGISREDSVAYLGVSFRDLASDIGESAAWERYESEGLWCFTPTYFLEEVLKRERPDVVVATTSPRMERAALRAAYRLGIPSLCLVELFGIQEESWISRPDNGDFAAISRPRTGDTLAAAGRDRGTIALTGSPMFDQLADSSLPASGRLWRQERGIDDSDHLVFWAEQPEPTQPLLPRQVRSHLAQVCRQRGWKLVVRLHPSSTDTSKEVMEPGLLVSRGDEPLTHVIHAADVAVTLTSTVGMEALLSDKPLLVPQLSPNTRLAPYSAEDGALTVPTMEMIELGLETLLTENEQSTRLATRRRLLPAIGGAAGRICDLIESPQFRNRILPYGRSGIGAGR